MTPEVHLSVLAPIGFVAIGSMGLLIGAEEPRQLAGWLAVDAWGVRGPRILVRATNGHGVRAGDSLRYRGISVGETDELWKRIPEPLRRYQSTTEIRPDGLIELQIEGVEVDFLVTDGIKEADFDKEFRRDPSRGAPRSSRRPR